MPDTITLKKTIAETKWRTVQPDNKKLPEPEFLTDQSLWDLFLDRARMIDGLGIEINEWLDDCEKEFHSRKIKLHPIASCRNS
jgi:hypothetical protein